MKTILTIIICILTLLCVIFVGLNTYHRNQLKKVNQLIQQDRIDDSIQQFNDSIKYRNIQRKMVEDSINNERRIKELVLRDSKSKNNKQIKKNEEIIKALPNSDHEFRDNIWTTRK